MADVKKYVVIGSSAAGTNGVRIPAAFFMHIWAVTAQKRDSASWSRILKSATE